MKKKQTDRAFFEYLYQTYEQKIYHLDKLFLPVFNYNGFDHLDSKNLQLIDIRQ